MKRLLVAAMVSLAMLSFARADEGAGPEIVNVGEKGAVTYQDKTLTVANVADGYTPIAFVDGAKVALTEGAYTVDGDDPAKIAVTYVKNTAWYLDPFVQGAFHVGYGYQAESADVAIDETEANVFFAIGRYQYNNMGSNGMYQFAKAEMDKFVGIEATCPGDANDVAAPVASAGQRNTNFTQTGTNQEVFRWLLPSANLGTVLVGQGYGATGHDGASLSYPYNSYWGDEKFGDSTQEDARYAIANCDIGNVCDQWQRIAPGNITANGRYIFAGGYARNFISKVEIVKDEGTGKITMLRPCGSDAEVSGVPGSATSLKGIHWKTAEGSTGNAPQAMALFENDGYVVYAQLADQKLYRLEGADDVSLAGEGDTGAREMVEIATLPRVYRSMTVTGKASGTPHLICSSANTFQAHTERQLIGGEWKDVVTNYTPVATSVTDVYALSADGKTLLSETPIVSIGGNTINGVQHGFQSLVSTDDETTAYGNQLYHPFPLQTYGTILTAAPSFYKVRAVYSNADQPVDYEVDATSGEFNQTFNAPKGMYIKSVVVNGQTVPVAAEATSFVYENDSVDGNILIVLTVENLPVAKIGEKTYTSLAAAFADVKTGDTLTLLSDAEIANTVELKTAMTLDLGGKKLTRAAGASGFMFTAAADINIVNGLIDGGAVRVLKVTNGTVILDDELRVTSTAYYFLQATGGVLTIGADCVVEAANDLMYVYGDSIVNIYGTLTVLAGAEGECPIAWAECQQINVYDGAVLTSHSVDVFRTSEGSPEINIYGGELSSVNGYCLLYSYRDSKTVYNIYGGTLTTAGTVPNSIFQIADDKLATVRPFDDQCKAKFSTIIKGWNDYALDHYCAEGYGLKKDGDWYVIAELPTVEAVSVGGKGTLTLDQSGSVAFGSKITGKITEVAAGYVPFVFVDGVKVAVGEDGAFEGVANNTAKVVATFAKDTAWYLDPFKRTSIGAVSNGYNPRACELDETEEYLLTGFSPDGVCGGPAEWDAAGVAATLNPAFACLQDKTSTITGDSARTLAVSKKYGVVFGPADFADGYPVHPLEEQWTAENGYVVKVDGTNPKGYGGAFGKDGFYSVYGSKVHLHEVQKDAETGVVTNLHAVKEWNVDMKAAWIRVVTINDRDIIYGGTYTSSTEGKFYAIDTADDSVVESPLALTPYSATYPTLAYTYNGFSISGVADGTPHVIIKDYCQIAVYALSSDFKTLASAEPIVILDNVVEGTTDFFENTFMAYGGIACLDDETLAYHICSYAEPQNHVRLSTWVKKPAKLIVRGTFSDEAHAEEDALVDFNGEANVPFAAPAGKKIVGVKVNGVADASFTDAAYTFTDAALTKNVYIEMTVDDLPVAKIGTTTYKTLNAAFAAAKAGDTVELLRDAAVGATIVPTVAVTLDLAGKTLSSAGAETIFDTAVTLTVTNGVASLGTAQFINMTDGANVAVNDVRVSGSHDPIFYAAVGGSKTLTIGKGTVVTVAGNSWFDFRDTTLNLYGSVTNAYDSSSGEKAEGAACWPCAGVNVINIYEGASMVSEREDFFRNNRGQVTYNIYGGTFYCSRDAIFYSYYKAKNGTESPVFNIYGGTFESVTLYKSYDKDWVDPTVTALDDTCQAKFKSNGFGAGYSLADFCAAGYEPVKGEDGYYTIQKASVEPTDPEEPIPSEDPEEDAKKMNNADGSVKPEFIKVPEGVTMDGTAKAAYASLFKAVPGAGVVTIELNEAGTNAVEAAEQAAGTAALGAVLGTDEASAALTVVEPLAGFFYSLKQSAAIESLDFKSGDKNKLGGRDTISFTLDKSEASGFYQMIVTPTPVK